MALEWIQEKNNETVNTATIDALRPFGVHNRTLTNDNGSEFSRPAVVEGELGIPVFYTDPGAPWQRGSVENANGLLRQYFPKGNESVQGHSWVTKALEETLNLRPRKRLGYRTPHEVFYGGQLDLLSSTLMHVGLEFSTLI